MTEIKPLMAGKRGLIMGVANDRSIAWGIAKPCMRMAPSSPSPIRAMRSASGSSPLAESVGSDIVLDCDVTDEASLDATFAALKERWGRLDFLVHAIAFSDQDELQGQYVDTTRANFLRTHGYLLLFLHRCRAARRAADDRGRQR